MSTAQNYIIETVCTFPRETVAEDNHAITLYVIWGNSIHSFKGLLQ